MHLVRFTPAAMLFAAAACPTLAQSVAPPAGSSSAVPEKTAPGTAPATSLDQQSGSLSKTLGKTDGVIEPKGDVDPAMHVPTPQTGSMPVVRPGDTGQGGVPK